MATLDINFQIPVVKDESSFEQDPGTITFAAWLPERQGEAIVVKEGNLIFKLWFDRSSIDIYSITHTRTKNPHIARRLSQLYGLDTGEYFTPMQVKIALGVITVQDISPKLKDYILSRTPDKEVYQSDLRIQHLGLAEKVVQITIDTYNQIVQYIRNYLGQYWVQEISRWKSIDQQCWRFDYRVLSSDNVFVPFCPRADKAHIKFELQAKPASDHKRYIDAEQWSSLKVFVEEGKRTLRYRALLADAEEIAADGHSRAAIVEAVAALEVALDQFAQSPNVEQLYGNKLSARMGGAPLKKQINHFGLSGSVNFLLPVLIPEDKLPLEVIEGCWLAIEQRNNVVHNGQREVKPEVWKNCLKSIRSYCSTLEELTKFSSASDVLPETQVDNEQST